jgi:hypothetical protein
MITKEGFIKAYGIEPESAEKLFNHLEERFNGDWEKATEYLEDVVVYLDKHMHQENVS